MKLLTHVVASIFMVITLTGCLDNSAGKNNVAVLDLGVILKATGQDEIFQQQIKQADVELSNQIKQLASALETKLKDLQKMFLI